MKANVRVRSLSVLPPNKMVSIIWINFVYNSPDCLTTCVSFHIGPHFSNAVMFPDLSNYCGERELS